jgi:hypothetical protein
MVLKRVGVMACGKVMGTMYLVIGFISGLVITIMSAFEADTGNLGGACNYFRVTPAGNIICRLTQACDPRTGWRSG